VEGGKSNQNCDKTVHSSPVQTTGSQSLMRYAAVDEAPFSTSPAWQRAQHSPMNTNMRHKCEPSRCRAANIPQYEYQNNASQLVLIEIFKSSLVHQVAILFAMRHCSDSMHGDASSLNGI